MAGSRTEGSCGQCIALLDGLGHRADDVLALVKLDQVQVPQGIDDVIRRELGDLANLLHADRARMRLQDLCRSRPAIEHNPSCRVCNNVATQILVCCGTFQQQAATDELSID